MNILTWNVEGLNEVAKKDVILKFGKTHSIPLLCAQETKASSFDFFINKAGKFYFSELLRHSPWGWIFLSFLF